MIRFIKLYFSPDSWTKKDMKYIKKKMRQWEKAMIGVVMVYAILYIGFLIWFWYETANR